MIFQHQGNDWKNNVKCYICGKIRHFKSECPEFTQKNSKNGENGSQATGGSSGSNTVSTNRNDNTIGSD